ncbi:MAG TPA: M67 family metallopeptidase [Acidimicrobiales bacterium]|nr:M67 family metallopeptidase [Acidimicrobiales bacterium]
MLRLTPRVYARMVGHCLDGLPLEACGLLAGDPPVAKVTVCYPTDNVAASARLYTVDPRQHLRADRDAEARGLEIIGVFHSHTHTEAFPSPTDVAQAPDPSWHYVVVSLRDLVPVTRSFRIVDGKVSEEPVVVEGR